MTDKKQDDQTMDSEHKSIRDTFERMNQSDDLQPSADLDAMILQQAADAVKTSTPTTIPSSDFDNLTFRRNRIIEQEAGMRKKSFLPIWAMPMGLAATVLLSLGVVTRVLQSPEFQELGMQSSPESVYDDSIIVTNESADVMPEMKVLSDEKKLEESKGLDRTNVAKDKSDYAASLPPVSYKPEAVDRDAIRARAENSNATVVLSPEQANSAGFSVGAVTTEQEQHKDAQNVLVSKRSRVQAETIIVTQSPPEIPAKTASDTQARLQANENYSSAAIGLEMEESVMPEPVVVEETRLSVATPHAGASVESDSNAYEVSENELDLTLFDNTLEEVVVTGLRKAEDFDAKPDLLTELVFEHRQCQVNHDCALVALACDSCDCVQAVNLSNLDKYASEFSVAEISEQCLAQSAECVLGYCQAREIEVVSD